MSDTYGATPPEEVPPQPAQSATNDVAGAWRQWLTNPENKASLMQFGISMLQPIGVGQSQAGHFASSVGQAGEAATRLQNQDLARRKAESDISLKEERANLAAERAGMTGQNLQLQYELMEMKRMLGSSQRAAELMKNYEAAKLLNPDLKLDDYMKRHQQAIQLIQSQEGGGGGGSLPSAGVGGAPSRAGATKPGGYNASGKTGPAEPGEIRYFQGTPYRFKGGNWQDKNAWEEMA